jgi:hypothetical protein
VAPVPRTRAQVVIETAHRLVDHRGVEPCEPGHVATDCRVEVGEGPAPERPEHAVLEVPGQREHGRAGPQLLGHGLEGAPPGVEGTDLGHVVVDDPLPGVHHRVEGEHDSHGSHPAQLVQTGAAVAPMVGGEDGEHRVEGAVGEGQGLGHTSDDRRRARASLGDHHCRGFDGHHRYVGRLVGAGTGADVEDAGRVTEGIGDGRGPGRIGPTSDGVADADPIVERGFRRGSARSVGIGGDGRPGVAPDGRKRLGPGATGPVLGVE